MTSRNSKAFGWAKKLTTLVALSTISLSTTMMPMANLVPSIVYADSVSYSKAVEVAKELKDKYNKAIKDAVGQEVLDNPGDALKGKGDSLLDEANKLYDQLRTYNDKIDTYVNMLKGNDNSQKAKAFENLFGKGVKPNEVSTSNIGSGYLKKLKDLSESYESLGKKIDDKKDSSSDDEDKDDKDKKEDTNDAENDKGKGQTNGVLSYQTLLGNIVLGKDMVVPGSSSYAQTAKDQDYFGFMKNFNKSSNQESIAYTSLGNSASRLTVKENKTYASKQGDILAKYLTSMKHYGYAETTKGNDDSGMWGRKTVALLISMANGLANGLQTIFDLFADVLVNMNFFEWLGFTDYSGSKDAKITNTKTSDKLQKSDKEKSKKSLQQGIESFLNGIGLNQKFMRTFIDLFITITCVAFGFALMRMFASRGFGNFGKVVSKYVVRFLTLPMLMLSASCVGVLTQAINEAVQPQVSDLSGIGEHFVNMEGWASIANFAPPTPLNASNADTALKTSTKRTNDYFAKINAQSYLALQPDPVKSNKASFASGKLSSAQQADMETRLLDAWADGTTFGANDYVADILEIADRGYENQISATGFNPALTSGKSLSASQADGDNANKSYVGVLTNSAQTGKDKTYVNSTVLGRYIWGVQADVVGDKEDNNKRISPSSTINVNILKGISDSKSGVGAVTYRKLPDTIGTKNGGLSNQSMVALLSSQVTDKKLDMYFYNIPRKVSREEGQMAQSTQPNTWRSVVMPSDSMLESFSIVFNIIVRVLSRCALIVGAFAIVLRAGLVERIVIFGRRLFGVIVSGRWEDAVSLTVYTVSTAAMIAFACVVPNVLLGIINPIGSFALTLLEGFGTTIANIVQAVLIFGLTYIIVRPRR